MTDDLTSYKTVVLLGAGASYASSFKLPVMRGFFGEDLNDFPRLHEFLKGFYYGQELADYNLEEVLGYLDISRNRSSRWGPVDIGTTRGHYDEFYADCIKYMELKLSVEHSSPPCRTHVGLFQSLTKSDTVISLNYDTIADDSLDMVESEYSSRGFRIRKLHDLLHARTDYKGGIPPVVLPYELEGGSLLKLHGSLDWLSCANRDCLNHQSIFTSRGGTDTPLREGNICRACGVNFESVIVPPVTTRKFADRGKLSLLWRIAYDELRLSRRWVIIGISLPATDFELRWLLRQAIEDREGSPLEVVAVNPNESQRKELHATLAGRGHVAVDFNGLADYVAAGALRANRA